MKCKKCGAELVQGAAFCMMCGTKVGLVCEKCGTELPNEAKFCFKCGTAVNVQESLEDDAKLIAQVQRFFEEESKKEEAERQAKAQAELRRVQEEAKKEMERKQSQEHIPSGMPVWDQVSTGGVCDCGTGECDCDGSIYH